MSIELIKQAIKQRQLIDFYYQGLHRIAEPHILGFSEGVLQVLVRQIRGKSSSNKLPGWRRMNLDDMSHLQILDETFSIQPSFYERHSSWDEILISIDN
jgi:hypothetical protein